MKINLKCCCGATFEIEDTRGSYLQPGGGVDSNGRKFLIEARADDWQERHQVCLQTFNTFEIKKLQGEKND
jgi:hypothetical protein